MPCSTSCIQKIPKKQVLHLIWWALRADRIMHRNFSVNIFFLESLVCSFLTKFITWELAFGFGMLIWNDSKWKSSCQEVMHKRGNWTKDYNWSASLKQMPIGCGTTNTTVMKKAHTQPVAGAFDAHTYARDKYKIGGRAQWYDHKRSSIVQCPQV